LDFNSNITFQIAVANGYLPIAVNRPQNELALSFRCKLAEQVEIEAVAPERILKWGGGGHRSSAQCQKKIFGRAPPPFGSKSTISRFGERFHDGQYSSVRFLFAVLLLTVPPSRAQPFVKVGGTCPPCPMESAPLDRSSNPSCYDRDSATLLNIHNHFTSATNHDQPSTNSTVYCLSTLSAAIFAAADGAPYQSAAPEAR